MFDSTRWVGFAAAAVLVVISLAAVFIGAQMSRKTGPALPPIQAAKIDPGFEGKHQFGLWTLICERVQGQAGPVRVCRTNARMIVRGPNNTQLLAAGFNIVMMKTQPVPGMMFRLPASARAAANIGFAVDQNTAFRAPLKCTQTECIAQGALPKDAVDQLRTGHMLSLFYTIKDATQHDRKVRVDQQLHGFRESFDAMTRAISA